MAYRNTSSRAGQSTNARPGMRSSPAPNLSLTTTFPNNGRLNGEASTFNPANSVNRYLAHDSVPDVPDGPLIVSSDGAAGPARFATVSGNGNTSTARDYPAPIGSKGMSPIRTQDTYTTDIKPGKWVGGHYVKLLITCNKYDWVLGELNSDGALQSCIRNFFVMPKAEGNRLTLFVCFDSVRVAAEVPNKIGLIDSTADMVYVTQPEFAAAQKEQESAGSITIGKPSAFFDGQVMFLAHYDGPVTASKPDTLADQVRKVASDNGNVMAFGEMTSSGGVARFRVEYTSIKAAKEVVKKLTADEPANVNGWMVYTEEIADLVSAAPSDNDTGNAGRGTPFGGSNRDGSPTFVSPTGRTGWSVDKTTGEMVPAPKTGDQRISPSHPAPFTIMPGSHMTPTMPLGYGPRPRHGPLAVQALLPGNAHHFGSQQLTPYPHAYEKVTQEGTDRNQFVDPAAINEGRDVRTTIMLRNLPHQTTCHTMKAILDASNFGEYDFSYVRIDYEREAAVGYGFVNFTSPDAIVRFMDAHVGRPWAPHLFEGKNNRPAAISYATVQGLDCCIEKFRNSSVMTEFVDYRPKLWHSKDNTDEDHLVGQEALFPGVNNESKHHRSLANASQIGLFPPQSRRGPGGRAGRSQFDRGTTAQQQEDAVFMLQNHMQQMHLAQAGPFNQQTPYPMMPMQHMPHMQLHPMQQGPAAYGAMVPYNPHYGNAASVMPTMPPHGYYQGPPAIMPPPTAQGYNNGHAFQNGHAYQNSHAFNNGHAFQNGHATNNGHAYQNGHAANNGYASNGNGHASNGNGHATNGAGRATNGNSNGNGLVPQGNRRASATPRSFDEGVLEERAKNYDGDVDVARMTGYQNPHSQSNRQQ